MNMIRYGSVIALSLAVLSAAAAWAQSPAVATGIDPALHAQNEPVSDDLIVVPWQSGSPGRAMPVEQAGISPTVPTPAPPPGEPSTAYAVLNNFDGPPHSGFIPPDPVMAVGPAEPKVLINVNGGIALYDTATQTAAVGPISWDGAGSYGGSFFGGPVTPAQFAFDPRCIYDPHDQRFWGVVLEGNKVDSTSWLRLYMSRADSTANPASNPDDLTLASPVATPGVGTHSWTGWNIDGDAGLTNEWADYPDIGCDDTNLYITNNMFGGPSNATQLFLRSRLWVIPKAQLIAESGTISTMTIHGDPGSELVDGFFNNNVFTIRTPIDYDSSGTYHLVSSGRVAFEGTSNGIEIWNVDPTTRALSNAGPSPEIARQVFVSPFGGFDAIDAPQNPGAIGADPIETGDVRPLNAIERGGNLWVTATNFKPNVGESHVLTSWYKVNPAGTGVPVGLDGGEVGGTTAGSADYFWSQMVVDAFGDPFLVMARTSSTEFAGIAVTGRDDDVDAAGSMQTPTIVQAGLVPYENLDSISRNRWGDYAGAAWDPTTGAIWGCHEYAFGDGGTPGTAGDEQWRIRIFSVSIEVPVELSVFTVE